MEFKLEREWLFRAERFCSRSTELIERLLSNEGEDETDRCLLLHSLKDYVEEIKENVVGVEEGILRKMREDA
jgi:hypothetical protein